MVHTAPGFGEDDYNKLVDEAVRFLRGESQSVREKYQQLMTEAADKLEFESAAKYRNRLQALAHVTSDQSINATGIEEADVFAAHQEGGQTCIQVFFFRTGQNWGNRAFYPRTGAGAGEAEVLQAFIAHRREVVTRRTLFDLRKARERAHILEGLAVALANIDEVIDLIKTSGSPAEAKAGLLDRLWGPGVVTAMLERRRAAGG